MNEADFSSEVQRWLRYAEEDLHASEAPNGHANVSPRHVCFQAQQAAETALKAALIYLRREVPRTHNLNALRNQLPADWLVTREHPNLTGLTDWAVEARYPGDWDDATPEDADEAPHLDQVLYAAIYSDLVAHGYSAGGTWAPADG